MEELADAIEDAQYVNAIASQDDGPKPVLPWEKPTEEELSQWETTVATEHISAPRAKGKPFSMEWICQQQIGFFLFSQYIKETHDDYPRINFVEEVLRYQQLQERSVRLEKAVTIAHDFLGLHQEAQRVENCDQEDGEGNPVTDSSSSFAVFSWPTPPRTEIEEYELARGVNQPNGAKVHNSATLSFTTTKSKRNLVDNDSASKTETTREELDAMVAVNCDFPICSECCVGVKGPVRKEIIDTLESSGELKQIFRRLEKLRSSSSPLQESPSLFLSPPLRSPDPSKSSASSKELEQERVAAALEALTSGPSNGGGERRESLSRSSFAHASNSTNPPPKPKSGLPTRCVSADAGITGTADAPAKTRQLSLKSDFFDKAEQVVMESLGREYWNGFVQSEYWFKLKNFLWYQDRRVVPEDFFVMRVLGRGGFGLVTACKKGTSGKLYAMKVMNKRRIKMKKSEPLAINERKALAAVESNFVINLKYSFHSKDDVFLILDLMTGGDLGFHLHQRGRFPKRECLYYAARIMFGLQALHDEQYVYRDLKPENCLLAEDGRVKITDLGLATKIRPSLSGAAGTRGYWAPEMLRRDSKGKRLTYDHTVDWFSFGCCVAEFISGTNPFRSDAALKFGLDNGKQTKEKAIDHATMEMNPEFPPEKFEPDAADFCRRLLDKNEKTRLGRNGCEEIMAHPWFKSINWGAIISDRKKPPYIPPKDVNAASQSEIGNFAEDKAYQETVITPKDEEVYRKWDWTNPRAFSAEVIEFLIYERVTGEPLLPVTQNGSCCCNIL